MWKTLLTAALWGLAVWTWTSMFHVILGIPDLGPYAGLIAAGTTVLWRMHTVTLDVRQSRRGPVLAKR